MNLDSAAFASQELLTEKIRTRTAKVGVIGLGYVGLPLAVEFANVGFFVTGIDVQASKVAELNSGASYIQDVPTDTVRKHVESGDLRATADFSVIAELDTVNIAVPTPLHKTGSAQESVIGPDFSGVCLRAGFSYSASDAR